jgi:Mrp family chromosome partitioning ATPase
MPESPGLQKVKDDIAANLDGVRQKIVILSGKGGVGKTSLAVNLSVALADSGRTVCLLDTDLHGPNVSRLLHLEDRMPDIRNNRLCPVSHSRNLAVVSPAFLSANNAALIWRGPMKSAAIRQLLLDVEWGKLDYLIVDSPPGTGDEPLTIAQLIPSPVAAVLVTTPQDVATDDVRKAASFCQRAGLPIAGIVENMSGMTCPHCGEQFFPFKRGGGKNVAAEFAVPLLGQIPFDPSIVIASDKGTPFVREFGDAPAANAVFEIAGRLPFPRQLEKKT